MLIPRTTNEYRDQVIKYSERSYTKTLFQGFIYRFLQELLKHDETNLAEQCPDLNDHTLAHLSSFQSGGTHESSQYSYSQLQNLLEKPLPKHRSGQLLFLGGHVPGSWIASIGAKYGIAPEFFRRHIHLWRSSHGAVLYAVPTLPSVNTRAGITLRINTSGGSSQSSGNLSLSSRRQLLPDRFVHNPAVLTPAPGSTFIRGHAYLGDSEFIIEQDISITIESDGEGWTVVLWSDVGSRDLSQSPNFHWFLNDLKACSQSGFHWIVLLPGGTLGIDSELRHPLPDLAQGPVDPHLARDGSLVQSAMHLPREFHLVLDHDIAAIDPLYALSPIFRFATGASNQALARITRRYEIISSTIWDPKHCVNYMNQLILHKHLLDDHACRHEEVLRYLRSPHLTHWAKDLTPEQTVIANAAKQAVTADLEYLIRRCREYSEHHQTAITILTSAAAMRESKKQISLATQVTKLTILATVFLPLSFCTGIFGMNFVELEHLSIWIWALVTLGIGLATLVVYEWDERERWIALLRRASERFGGGRRCEGVESMA